MTTIVGVDVSKTMFDMAVLGGKETLYASFPNRGKGFETLRQWLDKQSVHQAHFCMEATGRYSDALAGFLHQSGYQVSVVNPARVRYYADSLLSRNKTDRYDAYVLALYCRTQHPALWTPPDPVWVEVKALIHQINDLQATRVQYINRSKSLNPSAFVIQQIQTLIDTLDGAIKDVKQQLHQLLLKHPQWQRQVDRLTSIPGIGELTAWRLLAEIPRWASFDSAKQLAAYAGVTPRNRQSGSSRRRARMSKTGNKHLRTALYFPAIVAMRKDPQLAAFAQRLRERGLAGRAVIVAIMRKLLHIVYGVLKSGRVYDQNQLRAA